MRSAFGRLLVFVLLILGSLNARVFAEDLALTKQAGRFAGGGFTNQFRLGDSVAFTITFTNFGPATVSNIIGSDVLPAGLSFSSFLGTGTSGGTSPIYNPTNGVWTLGYLQQTNFTRLFIFARATNVGTFTNTAIITGSDTVEPNTNNNYASVVITVTLPEPPRPQIGYGGGLVTICWSNLSTCFGLESASSLSPPIAWQPVLDSAVITNGQRCLTLAATEAAQFYRLVSWPNFLATHLDLAAEEDELGNGSFLLTWNAAPGTNSYNVYYAAAPGVSKANYGSLPQGTARIGITNLYTVISNLTPGVRYHFVVTAVSPCGESAESNEASRLFGPHGSVDGRISTELVFGTNVTRVPLAGVNVTLGNLTNSTLSVNAVTDADGSFEFGDRPAGIYQLCWSANGFISGCYSNTLIVSNSPISLGVILISPLTNASTGLVYGQVTLQDGSPAVLEDSFYQINLVPTVSLATGGGAVVQSVVPNSAGQYVMAGVPRDPSLRLSARLENAGVTNTINTFVTGQADLMIPNSVPIISNLVATLGGQQVYRVQSGATVHVVATASDPDPGDVLQYRWVLADGTVLPTSGSQLDWTVPNITDGFTYLFLRVSDGKGGYASARLALTTNPYLIFSGQVTGSDTAAPLSNALVQLNNLATVTDTNGYFSFLVTQTNEYDVVVTSSGYVPLTKVWTGEAPDREYRLQKISAAPCIYNSLSPIQVTNSDGVVLYIPPNSLTDSNGASYFGCVSVALDTSNPCATNSEYSGGNLTLDGSVLSPYLFVNIDVRGSNSSPLDLSSGAVIQLAVPEAAGCFDPSDSAPVFFFDAPVAAPSRWTALAPGTKFDNNGFPIYIINVTNINFPPGNSPFGPAAVGQAKPKGALHLLADLTIHVPFTVVITPSGGPALKPIVITLDNDTVNDLAAGDAKIVVLNPRQSPGDYYDPAKGLIDDKDKDVIQSITATVTAGQTNKVTIGLGEADPSDNNKKRDVALTQDRAGVAFKQADVAALGFLNRIPKGSAANGDAYYKLIDPNNLKDSFTKWQQENGWAQVRPKVSGIISFLGNPDSLANAGAGDTEFALYFNANDLGAGRRMGMKIFQDRDNPRTDSVAYYVATYGTLKDAENDQKLKYIVCMEFSLDLDGSYTKPETKPKNPTRYIKFYAFNPDGSRSPKVPDEGPQPTFVPHVCMVCHGGARDAVDRATGEAPADVSGQFIGFDTANYTFGTKAGFNHDSLFANSKRPTLPNTVVNNNKNVFSSLNDGLLTAQNVKKTMPVNLDALIRALISGNGAATTPPAGWNDGTPNAASLYKDVHAVSCRSCHSTQGGSRNWSKAGDFPSEVYGDRTIRRPLMPQAQRSYSIFWGSATGHELKPTIPSQPATLSPGATPKIIK